MTLSEGYDKIVISSVFDSPVNIISDCVVPKNTDNLLNLSALQFSKGMFFLVF